MFLMTVGAVILFDVVATFGGGVFTTLGLGAALGCELDTDAMCQRNGNVTWLGCRIKGIGSDWMPGPHSNHWLRGGPKMPVMPGHHK